MISERFHARGNWQPATLVPRDLFIIKVVLALVAIVHGFDYWTGLQGSTIVEATSAQAFPTRVWALMLWVPACCLLVGVTFRRHFAVWLGHISLAGVYSLLVIALTRSAIYEEPPFDGVRFAALCIPPLAVHFGLSLRSGPRPGGLNRTVTVEAVMTGGPAADADKEPRA